VTINRTSDDLCEEVDDYISPRKEKIDFDSNERRSLRDAVEKRDFDLILDLLNKDAFLSTKAKNFAKKLLTGMHIELKSKLILELVDSSSLTHVQLAGLLMRNTKYWERDAKAFEEIMKKLGTHENWQPREVAAEILGYSLLDDKKNVSFLQKFVQSDIPELRRLAAVAARIGTKTKDDLFFDILKTIEPLLYDKNPYVASNMSPLTLGEKFLKWKPMETISWLCDHSKNIDDEVARASILRAFTTQASYVHQSKILEVIDHFLDDNRDEVRRTRESVLTNLCKYNEDTVNMFLESRLSHPAAMDHWANLSASGLIKNMNILDLEF
jgi:hypothetical protein